MPSWPGMRFLPLSLPKFPGRDGVAEHQEGGIAVNRLEKKKVRLQIGWLLDEKCKGCDYRRSIQSQDSPCIKTCPVGARLQSLGFMLDGDSREVYAQFAGTKRRWTEEEERYLISHYNYLNCTQIGNHLNRTINSVQKKAKLLGLTKPCAT